MAGSRHAAVPWRDFAESVSCLRTRSPREIGELLSRCPVRLEELLRAAATQIGADTTLDSLEHFDRQVASSVERGAICGSLRCVKPRGARSRKAHGPPLVRSATWIQLMDGTVKCRLMTDSMPTDGPWLDWLVLLRTLQQMPFQPALHRLCPERSLQRFRLLSRVGSSLALQPVWDSHVLGFLPLFESSDLEKQQPGGPVAPLRCGVREVASACPWILSLLVSLPAALLALQR